MIQPLSDKAVIELIYDFLVFHSPQKEWELKSCNKTPYCVIIMFILIDYWNMAIPTRTDTPTYRKT